MRILGMSNLMLNFKVNHQNKIKIKLYLLWKVQWQKSII